ncbi:endonuclease/exonuclease/phosphatase family protein [Sediminicola luteus]|uniref:Endonuclease/exonuclease/phosphatase domain-containing protein n=1 Tax=Sediminicola luteus TaxID=319238 RepID=A0A2A4G6X6_9FLAO|nr:endonuclease/exonuclease/phosphatase family protein [Sediminicola luteus]PCE63736.1 hypothetical protein B7P33_10695 [Sediminicola luteus]
MKTLTFNKNTLCIQLLLTIGFLIGWPDYTHISAQSQQKQAVELKVMTWNIWGKLNLEPKYEIEGVSARQRVIDIIKHSGADIVTMTEAYGSAADIAKSLGFYYYTPKPDANLCIFSRYELVDFGTLHGLSPFSFIAASVNLPNGSKVRVYNIWLTSEGRHIVEIKNKKVSDSVFNAGDTVRYHHLKQLLDHKEFKEDWQRRDMVPLIVAGDFNCVSHLDYTEATRKRKLNYGRILEAETSMAMADLGFRDTYRSVHPVINEDNLGYTWTTVGTDYTYVSGEGFMPVAEHPSPEYQNPYTRIDYIFATGTKIQVMESRTITRHFQDNTQRFPLFPSDHGAVLTHFRVE